MNAVRSFAAWGLLFGTVLPAHALVESATSPQVFWAPPAAGLEAAPPEVAGAFAAQIPGGWVLEWDAAAGRAAAGRLGFAPARAPVEAAAIEAAAEAFRARSAAFTGAAAAVLVRSRAAPGGRAWHVTWAQEAGGLPVFGAWLDVTLRADGEVVAFTSTLARDVAAPAPRRSAAEALQAVGARWGSGLRAEAASLVILPGHGAAPARSAWRLDVRRAAMERWDVLVDAGDGTVLRAESVVRTLVEGACTADVLPAYAQDAPVTRPLPWTRVVLTGGATQNTFGDAQGGFVFAAANPGGLRAGTDLHGRFLAVSNAAGEPGAHAGAEVPASGPVAVHLGTGSGRLDERTIYVHANHIHDDVRGRFDFRLLDFAMPAVAGEPALANAYWDGNGMHFGDGGNTFFNLGLFADVIYHEYTHGITDFMYRPFGGLDGGEGGALHEGLSDYFACTLTGEPLLGENLYRDGSGQYLRNLDHELVWPRDRRGEVHADGEIFAGALWDLRGSLGPEVTDVLVHFARNLGPKNFAAYANAVRLQDDLQFGDGNADNGSPHAADILLAFERHGLGPGVAAGRRLVHVPLTDTESVGAARRIVAGFEGHLSTADDVLQLFYGTGGPFTAAAMDRLPDGNFAADIPGSVLTEGARVRYYVRLVARRGVAGQTLPAQAPGTAFEFQVGPDAEPPVIEYTAAPASPAFAWPATVRARIHDNQAVAYAYVETWRDGLPDAFLGMVRDGLDPDVFTARFPNVGTASSAFEYRIVAVDAAAAANRRCAPSCDQTFRTVLVPSWQEDFESGGGGFEHGSARAGRADAWRLGALPALASSQGWRAGSDTEEYAPHVAAALVTPAAAAAAGAFATIRSWMDAEPNGPAEAFDAGVVQIELDGDQVWRLVTPEGGYPRVMAETGDTSVLPAGTPCWSGRDAVWRTLRFDLSPYAGHHVRLRFLFASDGTPSPFGYRGWALDDFHFEPGTRDASDAGPAANVPGGPRVTVLENPARRRAAFELWVPPGPAAWSLFDVRGRRVRTLALGPAAPGPRRADWDGRSERGVALPSGVYYYRLETVRGSAHGRFVFVR